MQITYSLNVPIYRSSQENHINRTYYINVQYYPIVFDIVLYVKWELNLICHVIVLQWSKEGMMTVYDNGSGLIPVHR